MHNINKFYFKPTLTYNLIPTRLVYVLRILWYPLYSNKQHCLIKPMEKLVLC